MSLLSDTRATIIAAASVAARFVGETLIHASCHLDEMLDGFSEYEAGDYLQTPAVAIGRAAEGPSAACDIPPSPAEGCPTCKHCDQPIEMETTELVNGAWQLVRTDETWYHTLGNDRVRIACKFDRGFVNGLIATPK